MSFAEFGPIPQIGSTEFFTKYMPRLKYHNPAVSMTVDRRAKKKMEARMTVYFAKQAAKGAAKPSEIGQAGAAGGPTKDITTGAEEDLRVVNIDTDMLYAPQIYEKLLETTGGKPVQHTPEEIEQMEEYERINREKAIDSVQKKEVAAKLNAERKAEEMARAAAAAAV